MYSENDRVDSFLEDLNVLSPEKLELILIIRSLFNKASKDLIEDIKYGGLVFNQSNVLIGGIFPYRQHVSIEFSNGVDFPDPEGLLEGKGKMRRHLKVFNTQDIEQKQADFFVKQAVKF